ncbi:MAG: hypothetical protein M3R63_07125 [Actinomycetota bacterium]|nr:hypothetical protein [Actinomycetota bacterium]
MTPSQAPAPGCHTCRYPHGRLHAPSGGSCPKRWGPSTRDEHAADAHPGMEGGFTLLTLPQLATDVA